MESREAVEIKSTTAPEAKTTREIQLEEIEGKEVLAWVAEQSKTINEQFATSEQFKKMEQTALSIYEDKSKIPYVSMGENGYFYNFWRDTTHVQGIWRRTTLEEYKKNNPQWELLLDIDNLPEQEKWKALINAKKHKNIDQEHWVYQGASRCQNSDRVLVKLSLGGTDALVVREFDTSKKEFIAEGFSLKEGKSRISWRDENSVWIGTDFGDDSLTKSGYPRIAKLWQRGEPLENAKIIFEGKPDDVSVSAGSQHRSEGDYHWVSRTLNFYESEKYLINSDLTLTRIPIPLDASLKEFFNGEVVIRLRKDWNVANGPTYKAGSVLTVTLSSIHDPEHLKTSLIFEPTDTCVVKSVSATKNYIIITSMNNVCSELNRYKLVDGKWLSSRLPLPEMGSASLTACEDTSDNCLLSYENFLMPATFYSYDDAENKLDILKCAPAYYDSEKMLANQFFAQSLDGTKIPYFVIHPKEMKCDGSNPTLLYGYGGFEHSLTPSYMGATGKLWLEEGGVYVIANIRGGGEFGPKWHQAALKENRHKAFEDFIAVAEDLIRKRITSPQHLGIKGGSNGGLLVGAALTMRPELFNAVICGQPLLDMMNYHTMLAGNSWMAEYGDPCDPKMREIIKSYSPYHNLSIDKKYPLVLFTSSTRDDRVHPGHARKMVDKMQSLGHKVYYYENTEGGHGGASNLKQSAFTTALQYSYLKQQLMKKNQLTVSKSKAENVMSFWNKHAKTLAMVSGGAILVGGAAALIARLHKR